MVSSPSNGHLYILGLGPGPEDLMTVQVQSTLSRVSDIFGYGPYISRIAVPATLNLHPSDNREEVQRATQALTLAATGRAVAVVSSGDAGVFAMASAVFEALEQGAEEWKNITIEVLPGVSAMLAASARLGAPLGHDFCAISLSDNLKPWDIIEKRLKAAAEGGFVIALYNPISKARPWQLERAFEIMRPYLPKHTPVMFATAVFRKEERLHISTLAEAKSCWADMRTLVIIGSQYTKTIPSNRAIPWVYTPRFIPRS